MSRRLAALTIAGLVCLAGCKVEQNQPRDQPDVKKSSAAPTEGAVVVVAGPTTDNAAQVIAACGPAGSDQIVTVNDKISNGNVRRMVYHTGRDVTLDFIPLQANTNNQPPPSNTVWRFNQAVVDNQRLLTAANIKVYLPCAATALAKEF